MSWHEFLDDDLRDLASLYVVGALEDGTLENSAARSFRLHLRTCDVCGLLNPRPARYEDASRDPA